MNDRVRSRTIVSAQSITLPKGGDVHLVPPPPKPCVTIVVHGVNDLAGCYERIERGLCQGLNERLDMPPTLPGGQANPGYLTPAGYSLPADDEGKAENPDVVYYRRKFASGAGGAAVRSVVVPFYWGFREEEQYINKTAATANGWTATATGWTSPAPRKAGSSSMPPPTCRTCGARVSTASCSVSSRWTGSAAP